MKQFILGNPAIAFGDSELAILEFLKRSVKSEMSLIPHVPAGGARSLADALLPEAKADAIASSALENLEFPRQRLD